MQSFYELIKSDEELPVNISIQSINGVDFHWHSEIEILLVLQGTINLRIGTDRYVLKENDLVLVNKNEVHSTSKTNEDNMLMVLQINLENYSKHYPELNKMVFDFRDFIETRGKEERFDKIKHHLAKIVWEANKKREGYQLLIASEVYLLISSIVHNFEYSILEMDDVIDNKDIDRIHRIISYINKNIGGKVTLKEIADEENLSIYHLSRFFKNKMGLSFQEYINNLRLDKAINLLSNSNKTMTEVSFESGFSSVKSFNNFFKSIFGFTPTEYRKGNNNLSPIDNDNNMEKKTKTYLDIDRSAALKILFNHLTLTEDKEQEANKYAKINESISINLQKKGVDYESYWKKLTTFSRASEGLRKNFQDQLEVLQSEIGFEYIRFHGIFCDDMMIYNYDKDGNIIYNWTYVDELFDFFRKVNIKPFIELGFMPSELKSTDDVAFFWWNANISGPRHINQWVDLVVEFIKHCINRYGIKEVETWYFEIWNEPELEKVFWVGGREKYFEFYKDTALAIKSVCKGLKVGGPSITHQAVSDSTWLQDFMIYCRENKVPLDFISFHIYPESYSEAEEVQDIIFRFSHGEKLLNLMDKYRDIKRIYFDENHTYDTITSVKNSINDFLTSKPEIHVTEWNASAYNGNLINDTSYIATFIVKNVLQSIGMVDSLGYWTFTDLMEEMKAGIWPFHGGFGLINNHGLKKPSFYAYYLLNKLGHEIIEQGDQYIVTRANEDIQILAYNFAYFDELFMNGDTTALTYTSRYHVFESKAQKRIDVDISNISGEYKITKYELDRKNGSVFDEWIKMGSPENMTEEEVNYLKAKSHPKITVENRNINNKYNDTLYIPVHGIQLILLEKRI